MARATTKTLLPLDRFAELIGMHPLHFNQVQVNALADIKICGDPILQYSWQYADRVGREEVAQAIQDAESQIAEYLGFDVLPKWNVDERLSTHQALRANRGYVISGGVEAKSLIDDAVAITYTDVDLDGYKERATITVATTVTNIEEIAIYYPGELGNNEWEIRPIQVAISGGIATIRCKREQLVKPDKMDGLDDNRAIEGTDDANFLTTVDVYRHYNDPQTQAQFMWEPSPYCSCNCDSCATCQFSTQNGCLLIREYRSSIMVAHPGEWNGTSFDSAYLIGCRHPDQMRLWYRAGWRDESLLTPMLTMAGKYERAVARLALSMLSRPLCGCADIEKVANYWRTDLAERRSTSGGSITSLISRRLLDNPFGTTRGAIYAWNTIKNDAIGYAALHR